jgi:hypothetical protein
VYEAFPDDAFGTLRSNNSRYSKLKGIQRGAQFQGYSTGRMVPRGERAPKGGAPGDTFGFYADMRPTNIDHIDVLFDHAEVCLSVQRDSTTAGLAYWASRTLVSS